jgi:iron complex outermembrane receptor protein
MHSKVRKSMTNNKLLNAAISAALALGASAFLSTSVLAQEVRETDDELLLEEVIVTGSAIRRNDLENTLPIQIITEQDIKAQGITNTADLIASVPAMQGFITPGDSVGGGGGGVRNANLRGLGDQYTLILLNGRRIAPADSGSIFDLQGIPLAAIERVEILTDGASALYGADAIAGVVNFILKSSVDATTVQARYDMPEASGGGDSWDASIVTGFGDIHEDGYSFVFTYQHQEREELRSADRDFAKTGFIFFNQPGYSDPLYFQNSSSNAIPGNAYAYGPGVTDPLRFLNPYAETNNGQCHENSTFVPSGDIGYGCAFDYTSTLFILPDTEADTLYLNGAYMVTDDIKLYGTVVGSESRLTAKIAPYPSGQFPIPLDSPLLDTYVYPYLSDEELGQINRVTAVWRGIPAGNRTTEYKTDTLNITVGAAGSTGNIDWDAAYTHTEATTDQNYTNGWLLLDEFIAASRGGLLNPFVWVDDLTDEDQAVIDGFVYNGPWDQVETNMDIVSGVGSMPMFNMGGGAAMVAAGFDWRSNSYDRWVSDINAAEGILFLSPDTPYGLERDQWGAFVETLFPFSSNIEATAAVRYDDVDGVKDTLRGQPLDNGDSGTTYKVSAKWSINDMISLRASYGTGFKAPSMREIGEPRSDFGVTSANFFCPFDASDPLAQYCVPGEQQYNVFREGYAGLVFEESTQYTAGFVFTPGGGFDATVDYWVIEMENLIERLTEEQIFGDPVTYRDLFTTKTNTATGLEELAIIQAAVNVGTKDSEGIDYRLHYNWQPSWAVVDFNLLGTHMLESDSSLTGSSLGQFGNDQAVVFEDKFQFITTVTFDNWTHNLIWDYKSSYADSAQEVEITGQGFPLGQGPGVEVQLTVPSYQLWNYSVRWDTFDDRLGVTFGVNNLLDEEPSLSLRTGGAGHQVGWDPRYTDAYGRTYWLRGEFSF